MNSIFSLSTLDITFNIVDWMLLHYAWLLLGSVIAIDASPFAKRDSTNGYITFGSPAADSVHTMYLKMQQGAFVLTKNRTEAHTFNLSDHTRSSRRSALGTGTQYGEMGIIVNSISGMFEEGFVNYGILADMEPVENGSIGILARNAVDEDRTRRISQSAIWHYNSNTRILNPTWLELLENDENQDRYLMVFMCPKRSYMFVTARIHLFMRHKKYTEKCGHARAGVLKFQPI